MDAPINLVEFENRQISINLADRENTEDLFSELLRESNLTETQKTLNRNL
jgi:hypothetical protein